MKGKKEVLEGLAEVLSAELTSINQYFVHHAMVENWGYGALAALIKQEAIDEMKHAEALVERILFLDGIPNMQKYFKIKVGKDVPDLFRKDLDLELEAVERLNTLIEAFDGAADHGSAELLKRLLADEEHHVDWLETQLSLIDSVGLQNYLARQMGGSEG